MEIIHYKAFYFVSILAMGLLAGLLPTFTGARFHAERFFSLGNALGGGVFLGAGLIHLLPDAINNYSGLLSPKLNYPVASLICAVGFLTVLMIEKVVVRGDEELLGAEASADKNGVYPYVLAIVLSVHAYIAGVALGAEDHVATSAALFVAVIAHKGIAAFALGVSLHRGKAPRGRSIGVLTLFSAMTPLGLATGTLLGILLSAETERWFEATFDALAAGTFLYVAVADIVEGEFAHRQDAWMKFLMMIIGLAIMALLASAT